MAKQKIMLGNEAIARGAYEAGVKVSAAYPGTPSTEISENLVQYDDIANGRRTRKLLLRWQLAHPSAVSVQWHR